MPNRVIRDGWISSKRIASLSFGARDFLIKCMLTADDYGRREVDPELMRSTLYPYELDKVSVRDVEAFLAECSRSENIVIYQVGKHSYLEIADFRQQVRAKKSKYPGPELAQQMIADDSRCLHLHTYARDDSDSDSDSEKSLTSKAVDVNAVGKRSDPRQLGVPTLEQVTAYAKERGRPELAEPYFDARESVGWRKGINNSPIYDYRADFRAWSRAYDDQRAKDDEERPPGKRGRPPRDEDVTHWQPAPKIEISPTAIPCPPELAAQIKRTLGVISAKPKPESASRPHTAAIAGDGAGGAGLPLDRAAVLRRGGGEARAP